MYLGDVGIGEEPTTVGGYGVVRRRVARHNNGLDGSLIMGISSVVS